MSITTLCYRCFRPTRYVLTPGAFEMSPYLFGYARLHDRRISWPAHIKCPQPVFITIEIP